MHSNFIAALLTATISANLKVGVISDSHFNTIYNAYSSSSICTGTDVSGEIVAPVGRYGCDPSEDLLDLMYTRFKEVYGTVDVILVPGDSAAHKVAASKEGDDPTASHYTAVKANLAATFAKFQEHFPNTVILPTFGNNDGRYHDEAIDEADKSDYYNFVYDLWFNQLTGNAGLDLASIKSTLLSGGYYRADITSTVTVLSLNSMYMDFEDNAVHNGEVNLISKWMEYQLALAKSEGRKVIIMDHVYAGSRFQAEELWHEDYNTQYFSTLRTYHDQVIMEVVGHDHFADLRYHSSNNVCNLPDTDVKFDFHNMFVAAGLTPYDGSNPGVSKFEITSTGVPTNLHIEFLDLNSTFGKSSVSYSNAKFFSVDWATSFGVTSLDGESLATFRKKLEADETYTLNYLVTKLGFNPSDSTQKQMGIDILTGIDLVTSSKHHTGEYICQMHQSVTPSEYDACAQAANPSLFLQ